jgi:hypothetical protein
MNFVVLCMEGLGMATPGKERTGMAERGEARLGSAG